MEDFESDLDYLQMEQDIHCFEITLTSSYIDIKVSVYTKALYLVFESTEHII